MDFISTLAFLVAPSKIDKWARALTDNTFAGIHQLDWFDYLLLVPYFTLLTILAIYGAHRYAVVRGYLEQYAGTRSAQEQALTKLLALSEQTRSKRGRRKWTREELHER